MSKKAKYENDSKRKYRESVWDALLSGRSREEIANLNIAYLSGSSAEETLALLSRGADPDKLHAIDSVPANVATVNREVKAALGVTVNAYGCDLSEAIRKITKRTKLDVVSLDFCGNISLKMLLDVESVLRFHVLVSEAMVGVTYQKGREDRLIKKVLHSVGGRRDALELTLSGDKSTEFRLPFLVDEGRYQNNRTPMAWHSWRCVFTEDTFNWKSEELEYVKHVINRNFNAPKIASLLPNRTAISVADRVRALGLNNNGQFIFWSDEENLILTDGCEKGLYYSHIASKLDIRSRDAVRRQAKRMGVTNGRQSIPWSDEEKSVFLKGLKSGLTYAQIADKLPKRSRETVKSYARDSKQRPRRKP